ncbi:sugar ABC transporter substrate-binding protein [Actinoplanes sp. KI2]|uniref:multiple monosaccharide ABC transporter substrate-binding protein n=1 Tax=Actinoplanes sp. KI2 TaxID=2983315 RepID=UPI0021D59685|nr:multiple monosaccharide ABC transporter substrate-binding protein [Actinoplanes sp. KI2]MCU7730720.1 sugar ABC transporter substrate-binding protein [Actinoplanes sp. KI2]
MTRSPIRFGLPVAALLLACTAACGTNSLATLSDNAPNPGTIGISMPTKTEQRWIADGDNMVKQFQALGYGTDIQYTEKDAQQQAQQLNAMIDRGDKALVIGAVDGTVLKDALKKAHDKGIPVISYDRLIRGSADVDYYCSFDNFKVGVLQATTIVNHLGLKNTSKTFNIELFAGSGDDNNATFFFNGAMSVLKPYIKSGTLVVPSGETSFTEVATAGWDGKVAAARMAKLLAGADSGVKLDAVLSPNDGIGRALIGALKEGGYSKLPVITGQDAELDSVKLVNQGVQTQTVYKDTRELAKVAVQMTNKILSGQKPDINDTTTYNNGVSVIPSFLLQPVSVEKANLVSVLVDGGYYSKADLS